MASSDPTERSDRTEGDGYEQKYMTDGAPVLARQKARASNAMLALLALPSIIALITVPILLATKAPQSAIAPAIAFFFGFFLMMLFAVLRITVSATHVHVQYGLWGPKIPTAAIEKVEAVHYDWKEYGGFGIRRGGDGSWAYNMMGDQGRAVRIVWRDAKGRESITLISAPDPDALVKAIEKARAGASPSASAKKRVDARPKPTAAELAEAEAELEAELAPDAPASAKRAD